jgi:hypothetical protein
VIRPEAIVVHSSTARFRIRIPDCRGDLPYFSEVRKAALKAPFELICANATTGSILFTGPQTTLDAVAAFGSDNGLYAIKSTLPVTNLANRISNPLDSCNRGIKNLSFGQLDLPGALIILLLFVAIYEIARGRFRTPPWYTAFWYAFGLFTKAVINRETDDARQQNSP